MTRLKIVMLTIIIIVIVVLASLELSSYLQGGGNKGVPSGFYVGVSFCGNTTAQAELLIDKVKGYTNLFVVQSGPVSDNETALNEIVSYAVNAGLSVIVYFGFFNSYQAWRVPWLDYAKQQWHSNFLGIYLDDEPGGQITDANYTEYYNQLRIHDASDYFAHEQSIQLVLNGSLPYSDYEAFEAAYHFVADWKAALELNNLQSRSISSFTSDYALYWFDYKIGYSTIFAELGSNQSTAREIDMARGAANLQNKTWGTIITWTYEQAPYIENGSAMYNDLVTSYIAGAKYEVIFDYPQVGNNPYGTLTSQHFDALQKFWNNIHTLKTNSNPDNVLVLPPNYGGGMRTPNDLIWGQWRNETVSSQIWNTTQNLLNMYGDNLDIVYPDQNYPFQGKYQQIYYWNQTS